MVNAMAQERGWVPTLTLQLADGALLPDMNQPPTTIIPPHTLFVFVLGLKSTTTHASLATSSLPSTAPDGVEAR